MHGIRTPFQSTAQFSHAARRARQSPQAGCGSWSGFNTVVDTLLDLFPWIQNHITQSISAAAGEWTTVNLEQGADALFSGHGAKAQSTAAMTRFPGLDKCLNNTPGRLRPRARISPCCPQLGRSWTLLSRLATSPDTHRSRAPIADFQRRPLGCALRRRRHPTIGLVHRWRRHRPRCLRCANRWREITSLTHIQFGNQTRPLTTARCQLVLAMQSAVAHPHFPMQTAAVSQHSAVVVAPVTCCCLAMLWINAADLW